jgi:excisionase family DNA binding protein
MIRNADITSARLETERTATENFHHSARNPDLGSPMSEFRRLRILYGRDSKATDVAANHLLRVEEVALLLNVPRKWVYRRIGLKPPNGIPHLKVGKYVRFKESDIWDYVERLRRNS